MKPQFSIAALLFLTLVSAGAIHVWQISRPLDHFELAVSGILLEELPPDTTIVIVRNPDYHRSIDCELALGDLPAQLPHGFSKSGCVVEFWANNNLGQEERLFSVVLDKELFDKFRLITVKLDEPTVVLKPDLDFWASQAWSPNITQRMRYRELPWVNPATQMLAPLPELPTMTVSRDDIILEQCVLKKHQCMLDSYHGEFGENGYPHLQHGDILLFSVTYESGAFDPIETSFLLKYDSKRHVK